MAESCAKAFGRYLKMLRERRGLSLDDVRSLSQTFSEKLNKGYMSRCENGLQKLAFPKVVPLSRIYQVPADVLVERMELDLELDRIGGPDTEGRPYSELTEQGKTALQEGFAWIGYGYLRDAVNRAGTDTVRPSFRDQNEQIVIAQMSCGSAARALGRYRFALHEFLFLEGTGEFSPKFHSIILERISRCYTGKKEYELAAVFADRAVSEAESIEDREYLGYIYDNRGWIAMQRSDYETAISFYQKAFRELKDAGHDDTCVGALNNLALCYIATERYASARRASEASTKIGSQLNSRKSRAVSQMILGEIDEKENRPVRARERWREAAEIAKTLDDKELRFKAEFVLFRRAMKDGDAAVARAIQRRLRKLSPWISGETEELEEFRRIVSETQI